MMKTWLDLINSQQNEVLVHTNEETKEVPKTKEELQKDRDWYDEELKRNMEQVIRNEKIPKFYDLVIKGREYMDTLHKRIKKVDEEIKKFQ